MSTKQIIVKTSLGQIITVDVSNKDKIIEIKKKIQEKNEIPCCCQKLIYCGKELDDCRTIQDYEIDKASTLHLLIIKL